VKPAGGFIPPLVKETTNMSNKLRAPVLAALSTLAAIASSPVYAQCGTSRHDANSCPYQSPIYDQKGAAPPRLHPFAAPPSETDPDPNVRFEMNRDNRDHRQS
jgi:hypothetical protein